MSPRLIYFDTETTGVRPEKDRIIELAAYDSATGQIFEQLINPKMAIPAEATKVHKITNAMVANAPDFGQVAKDFMLFCEGDVALIGHNSDGFDLPFLRAEFTRNGLVLPQNWIFVDSLKWARKYRKDLPRHSLQFLRQIYGVAENEAHRALNDVMVLYEVFQAMADDLTTKQVISLLGGPVKRQAILPETKKPALMPTLFN